MCGLFDPFTRDTYEPTEGNFCGRLTLVEPNRPEAVLARNAVDQMLTQVGNKDLVYVLQMEPLRRALLEKALQFYRTFLDGNPDDPGIRLETANAYQRIGQLYDRLGQYADAERTHRESIRILEGLEAEFSTEPKYELQVADASRALTNTLIHLRQWPKAEQASLALPVGLT